MKRSRANEAFATAMALANDADEDSGAGDPLDLALLEYAKRRGVALDLLRLERPRRSSLPFDSSYKYMRATVEENGSLVSYLKGAPEVILQRCRFSAEERINWEEKAEGYAGEGFRAPAFGRRNGEGDEGLEFLGLALLWDPPRPEVPEAIRRAQEAGIRVVMVTGDHPATALAVAHEAQTAIFLHATMGRLFYAYPARRINAPPQFNGALHLSVILGIGLQLLTVLLPSLRTLLGLEPLTLELLTLVAAAVLLTWGAAEVYTRGALLTHHAQEKTV